MYLGVDALQKAAVKHDCFGMNIILMLLS